MTKDKGYNDNSLKYYFDQIKIGNLLTPEEEVELSKRIQKGDALALDKMIRCNLRLVVKIAKRYMTPEWQLCDLIQEGNIGLMKAAEKFDYRKKVKFSTYASWWIKQAIIRSISNKRRIIRLPHRKEEKLKKINKTISELTQELNRSPSVEEISDKVGYKEIDIINLKNITENFVSIDSEVNEEGFVFLNFLNDEKYCPERILSQDNLKKLTEEILESLKIKEKEILKQRFAFDDRKKETLKSIAKKLGISPESVRQIEIKAIKKIRENYPHLKEYLIY
ncbi:MAG TPA: RNA polymerase sigma factor RpoD/SigA [Spirochaetota bacterium]|nr:RNA polymerase sigma factor RpoD/SigA [Spirochaetota bacterium]HOF00503.1 RNA polymerase sigma factor RpoD/SigA [Spirochaetota bacterium]HOS33042.1 RNA polymerase sigma factor RpoD/SigA [Spirochaetota bacterium]HOS55529.1 RNA polymerase sigma factor RpoD/SigA [Spirochaetota bacterium]HPK62589.1 RNA polymerase sigma factor RpoD/SigA [Spirochaetota bacterium]